MERLIEEYKQLGNPPIKEVIIGLLLDGLFVNKDEIQAFYDNFSLKNKYVKQESITSVSFEIGNEPKIAQNIADGIVLKTEAEDEIIQIEPNKIMFIDRNKYIGFNNFFNKFEAIIANISKMYNQEIEIADIGLRYINNFNFLIDDIDKHFIIHPTLNTNTEKCPYALKNNYLSVASIISTVNPQMFATVKTLFQIANPVTLNITFDIDTHINKTYKLNDLGGVKSKVLELKCFKNQIFFSNFNDIYNIEEFK